MLDEQALKERLRKIAADNYEAPTRPERYPLVLAMGTYTGSPDPELRDDLIYMTMATWIERDVFDAKELKEILGVVLNNQHLFYGLGDKDNDTVFTRTFSMLIVPAVISAHRRHPFLPNEELRVIQSKLLRYLDGEKDWRGYIPGKGWAHAAAHAADALEELVQCTALEAEDIQELLAAMRELVSIDETVYVCEEDERLTSAVLAAWQRDEIDDQAIVHWLQELLPGEDQNIPFESKYRSFINTKNFLRSLTFRTQHHALSENVQQAIGDLLLRFNRFQN